MKKKVTNSLLPKLEKIHSANRPNRRATPPCSVARHSAKQTSLLIPTTTPQLPHVHYHYQYHHLLHPQTLPFAPAPVLAGSCLWGCFFRLRGGATSGPSRVRMLSSSQIPSPERKDGRSGVGEGVRDCFWPDAWKDSEGQMHNKACTEQNIT